MSTDKFFADDEGVLATYEFDYGEMRRVGCEAIGIYWHIAARP
jgi:hypothetical protein